MRVQDGAELREFFVLFCLFSFVVFFLFLLRFLLLLLLFFLEWKRLFVVLTERGNLPARIPATPERHMRASGPPPCGIHTSDARLVPLSSSVWIISGGEERIYIYIFICIWRWNIKKKKKRKKSFRNNSV